MGWLEIFKKPSLISFEMQTEVSGREELRHVWMRPVCPEAFLLNSSLGKKSIRNLVTVIVITIGFIY